MKTSYLKKQYCQVGHPAVKCSEPGDVGRNSNLRAPLSQYKNDWYSTSCTLNITCKDSLKNSKLRQEPSHLDWWPCVTPVYGLWPLETSKWTKSNITAPFAQWSKDAPLRNQTVLSKNKTLSSKKCQTFNTFDSFHIQYMQKWVWWMQTKHPECFFDIKDP